jgi:hypothetical protein
MANGLVSVIEWLKELEGCCAQIVKSVMAAGHFRRNSSDRLRLVQSETADF